MLQARNRAQAASTSGTFGLMAMKQAQVKPLASLACSEALLLRRQAAQLKPGNRAHAASTDGTFGLKATKHRQEAQVEAHASSATRTLARRDCMTLRARAHPRIAQPAGR